MSAVEVLGLNAVLITTDTGHTSLVACKQKYRFRVFRQMKISDLRRDVVPGQRGPAYPASKVLRGRLALTIGIVANSPGV